MSMNILWMNLIETPTGLKYQICWNGYDSNADIWEEISQIPRSYILAYVMQINTEPLQ